MSNHKMGHLALSDNGFLFDTTTGFTFTLNGVGKFVLQQMINGHPPTAIVDNLVELYDVPRNTASRDVDRFKATLKELNLTPGA